MKEIITNKNIRHGNPIIKGTRITSKELIGMIVGGMTYDEIEREYGIKKERIFKIMKGFGALKGIGSWNREEDRMKSRYDYH